MVIFEQESFSQIFKSLSVKLSDENDMVEAFLHPTKTMRLNKKNRRNFMIQKYKVFIMIRESVLLFLQKLIYEI